MPLYCHLRRVVLVCALLVLTSVQAKPCLNPSVRREWRALSRHERAEWVRAVKCLAKLPHDDTLTPSFDLSITLIPPVNRSSSYYDDITYVHMDLNPVIHYTGLFLPWHRAYILGFEQALKKKCKYRGTQPYWDWSRDTADLYHAAIFDPNPESGFGGWGDPSDDYQITTGAFSKDFPAAYPVPHRVRRQFTLQPFLGQDVPAPFTDQLMINTSFSKSHVEHLLNSPDGDYKSFQAYFEAPFVGPHGGVHLILGGDMTGACPAAAGPNCVEGPKWSPSDPLFFMHHAMVDKLWYQWQHKNPKNFWAYHGGSVSTFGNDTFKIYPNGAPPFLHLNSTVPGDELLWHNKTIFDYMDTMTEGLCYIYE